MRLFQGAGFAIQRIDGINPFLSHESGDKALWRRYSLFSWLPINRIKDMRYQQFAIVAKARVIGITELLDTRLIQSLNSIARRPVPDLQGWDLIETQYEHDTF